MSASAPAVACALEGKVIKQTLFCPGAVDLSAKAPDVLRITEATAKNAILLIYILLSCEVRRRGLLHFFYSSEFWHREGFSNHAKRGYGAEVPVPSAARHRSGIAL